MNRHAPEQDINEDDLQIHPPKQAAAGLKAVTVALERGYAQAGVSRTVRSMLRVNQHGGFDCPGCAWPESITGKRSPAEFCENGAKAIAEESTTRTVGAEFWARHSLAELEDKTEYWLGSQGRLSEPVVIKPGDTHYSPISWSDAFALIGEHINATTPDKCVFYTSGRTANETAFMYQLFARSLGTNNLPDCSNMCHESSGSALNPTIGIGKGTVSLEDIHHAELVLVVGQNPGTNHPRMLSALRDCKNNGGKIIAVNPLPEAGLLNFKDPQSLNGVIGGGTTIADEFLQIKVGGDLALFQALGHLLLEEEKRNPGTVVDHSFIDDQTEGFAAYNEARSVLDWDETERATGLTRAEITKAAGMMAASKATIICWALGLTQQPHSVDTLREIINLLLLQGNFGKRGAGACPVRGHSNVQGDRTMGIWEKPKESFLAALDAEFGFHMPRDHGYDSVETQHALEKGEVDVFVSMGGNFAAAGSDTAALEEGLKKAGLTVHISTKPNRAHVVHGKTSLILPTLGRTDTDDKHPKGKQFLSVEDSMSVIHKTQGRLEPVSEHLLSEPVIVARMAQATLGDHHSVDWRAMAEDYDVIRDHISRVIPGFEDFNARVRTKNGFVLPNPPRDTRTFATDIGKGRFSVRPLEYLEAPPGHLILQTVRSHDQYNTTFYGLDDRYRGVSEGRRVILVHPEDLADLGFEDRDLVDVISTFAGTERRANRFRLIGYPTAKGCAAAYFPEANALVHRELVARESNTPGYKAMTVRFVKHEENGS
ncbi:FdhF/YdeP family oxidoreductase [Paenarthrobacter aurescens]|uniref:Formate dehydrogenase subunit alpha n=1 Tax=Paenarthrobacter aurescens TaxID=43663 RepID=A0A4Y3NHT1_PAEAU|nr:FdhF/YdeP family oxidoreductase [Paenarthrobacter aurescens]MDO6142607.1 FdhF/YdeP family oxidoreductase [Paenarthrobacter aurescens]MDO6146454.1 FdhF/YdeP family oxidoreductase [Paenarthrobacter aurescens]MDO6157699.1 FdhF/YdeP family oxidoreductase [Paenarthrobacter aurescens]MDO6161684.1 FdhF/YdeP family oxidoreductase [Paenarthrobacter aurescens]GEB20773.1 formate dehydrogenase subunit alpha [Paenarthrobacter aurescens]